jgi:hypothetical protein
MFSVITHLSEVQHMKRAHIAILSAAATCLLPFATPAIAQNLTRPQHHHALRVHSIPPGATALAPETGIAGAPLANGRCHVDARLVTGTLNYPEYITTCR